MNDASAETEVLSAMYPRQRVRELELKTVEIRGSRLSDSERRIPTARVCGRGGGRAPKRNGIAIQVGKSGLVEKIWAEDRRHISLHCPGPARISTSYAGRIRTADGIL